MLSISRHESSSGKAEAPPVRAVGDAVPGSFDSAALLGGGSEVLIRHGVETYRLRVTRQNRLILTK